MPGYLYQGYLSLGAPKRTENPLCALVKVGNCIASKPATAPRTSPASEKSSPKYRESYRYSRLTCRDLAVWDDYRER
jgi:hypothetical protein